MAAILALPLACSVCGQHCKKSPNGCGTGYGLDANNNRVCYSCCAAGDLEHMIKEGAISLYLTCGGGKGYAGYTVSNWPGSLKFDVTYVKHSWHNFAGKNGRSDAWFNGPDGHVWHAVRIGDMDICRCKRTKQVWKKEAA